MPCAVAKRELKLVKRSNVKLSCCYWCWWPKGRKWAKYWGHWDIGARKDQGPGKLFSILKRGDCCKVSKWAVKCLPLIFVIVSFLEKLILINLSCWDRCQRVALLRARNRAEIRLPSVSNIVKIIWAECQLETHTFSFFSSMKSSICYRNVSERLQSVEITAKLLTCHTSVQCKLEKSFIPTYWLLLDIPFCSSLLFENMSQIIIEWEDLLPQILLCHLKKCPAFDSTRE